MISRQILAVISNVLFSFQLIHEAFVENLLTDSLIVGEEDHDLGCTIDDRLVLGPPAFFGLVDNTPSHCC